jgi:leucine-zipper-like transcriptional regulator 1
MKRILLLALIVLIFGAVLFISCKKKNNAPDIPSIPAGPSNGSIHIEYNFTSSAEDPDGDSIAIRFDWGDGDKSDWGSWKPSNASDTMSHSWTDSGSYSIKAQAKDKQGATSDWSETHSIRIIRNQPPNVPATPSGPSNGPKNSLYEFTTITTDPDNDGVCYRFDWGDGDTSDWSAWMQGGVPISITHSWSRAGTYQVRAQAKDVIDVPSFWSNSHQIIIENPNPPYTPSTPSGPSNGKPNILYSFSSSAIDPDGDSIAIRFDWGDGDTSNWNSYGPSGQNITMNHSWSSIDTYYLKAQAKDEDGATSSWSSGHQVVIRNRPPNTPSDPFGPWIGEVDTSYDFLSSATDPDGDSVEIRFDWGGGDTSNWSSLVPSGQTVRMSHSWSDTGTYYAKAQAKDKDGAISEWSYEHSIYIYPWHCATTSAAWSGRYGHTSVVFDNKIWVLGGGYEGRFNNDVWYSTDGVNWFCATDSAGWSKRGYHTSVVFNNKIWVLGGRDPYNRNDVWYSTDGVNWTQATPSAGWSGRWEHTSIVFDNKIWVLGAGESGDDIWYSTDGVNWTCVTSSAGWSPRGRHTSVVFDNKMWVLGGYYYNNYNDVWFSADGINWTCATDSAEWSPRCSHTSVVFDDKMWVLGGIYQTETYNDVWFSSNGTNWTQATANAGWLPRYFHTSVVFENRMWVLGGGDCLNDVWYWP